MSSRNDKRISVVIPSISGREHWLERALEAYERTSAGAKLELIVIRDRPACGPAWEEGAEQASGAFLHFSADDLEPQEGWWRPAVDVARSGRLPCPRVLNPNGSLQSCGEWGQEMPDGTETYIARVPFLSRKQWKLGGWIFPRHYYGDNWVSFRGAQLGIPTVVVRDYLFTHHFAPEGRLSNEQLQADYVEFLRWQQRP